MPDFGDCLRFVKENPVGYVATVEGDQPRVRVFLAWYADETGFYFHTSEPKKVCSQLRKNPKVEVCFCTPKWDKVMRVAGSVEFVNDLALKTRLLKERPFLKGVAKGPEDPTLVVFRIPHGDAYFWTRTDNMKEAEIPRIRF